MESKEKILCKWKDGNYCVIIKNFRYKNRKDITFSYLGYVLGQPGVNAWVMDKSEFSSREDFEYALDVLKKLNKTYSNLTYNEDHKFVREYMEGIKPPETPPPPPSKEIYGFPKIDIDMDHPGIIKGQKK